MENNELKPCECGGKAELKYFDEIVGRNEEARGYFVICTVCENMGKIVGFYTACNEAKRKEIAINDWNRRANDGT